MTPLALAVHIEAECARQHKVAKDVALLIQIAFDALDFAEQAQADPCVIADQFLWSEMIRRPEQFGTVLS